MKSREITQIDAFADRPFTGNPAAVCVLASGESWDERWMQSVALEMNLSETAFVRPAGQGLFDLRWFTPADEVNLCGHATLATAHHLWESGVLAPGAQASFQTRSGTLVARQAPNGRIELDFPAIELEPGQAEPVFERAFDIPVSYLGRGSNGYELLEAESDEALRACNPNLSLLAVLKRGIIVTAKSSQPEFDFISRFFSAHDGIGEDPVTGSAHCVLGPFWTKRLGKSLFSAYQASPRGGHLEVELRGTRILLRGRAVTVLRGQFLA